VAVFEGAEERAEGVTRFWILDFGLREICTQTNWILDPSASARIGFGFWIERNGRSRDRISREIYE
jgi:hypothetical protein